MCGILALAFKKPPDDASISIAKEILKSLLLSSESRGDDATGVVVCNRLFDGNKSENVLVKGNIPAKELVEKEEYLETIESICKNTTMILGHCRNATKGATDNLNNNHPIVIQKTEKEILFGVHNGSINNDAMIWTQKIKRIKQVGEVDSEAIFALFAEKAIGTVSWANVRNVFKETNGGRVVLFYQANEPDVLYFGRDSGTNQDLYYSYFKDAGLYIFAQEEKFIEELNIKLDIKEIKDREIGRLLLREKGNIFIQKIFTTQNTTQFVSDKDKTLSVLSKWEKICESKRTNGAVRAVVSSIVKEIKDRLK